MHLSNRVGIGLVLGLSACTLLGSAKMVAADVRIVVSAKLAGSTEYDCFIMDRDGGNVTNLTADYWGDCVRATISPDGSMMAFQDQSQIEIMDLDTRMLREPPLSPSTLYKLGDWLDNDTLVFAGSHSGARVIDIDGSNEQAIPGSPQAWAYFTRVSYDGTRIVCDFADPYNHYSANIYVHYVGSAGWSPLVTDAERDSAPCWAADNETVYYQHEDARPGYDSLRQVSESTGTMESIAPAAQGWYIRDAAPDRDELLILRGGELRVRDLTLCDPSDPLACETVIWSAEFINNAQYFSAEDAPLCGDGICDGDILVGNYHGNFSGYPNAIWHLGADGSMKSNPLVYPNGPSTGQTRMHSIRFAPSGEHFYVQVQDARVWQGYDAIKKYDGNTGAYLGDLFDANTSYSVAFDMISDTKIVFSGDNAQGSLDLKIFDMTTQSVTTIDTGLIGCWGVAYSPAVDRIYASLYYDDVIYEYERNGVTWERRNSSLGSGLVHNPEFMDCSGDGRLLVGNRYATYVSEFDLTTGQHTAYDMSAWTGDCMGVAYGNNGAFYVTTYEQANQLIRYEPGTGQGQVLLERYNPSRDLFAVDVKPLSSTCGDGICADDENSCSCPGDCPGQCCYGDPCTDGDLDNVPDSIDNCPADTNADQADSDWDDVGDVCDSCPNNPNSDQVDTDGDGIGDVCDVESIMYDGDTLLSTAGEPTANANLIASLRGLDGSVLDLDGEQVTFALTGEGVAPLSITTASLDGVATTTATLAPAIYAIEITAEGWDAVGHGILVVYNPDGGFATGGGWIVPADDGLNTHPNVRANFGFNAKYKQGSATGHIEFRYSDGHINLNSDSIEQLVITGGKIAQFKGWATVNGTPAHWFFAKAIDNGEPGKDGDTFEIKTWAPGVDPEGDPTERAGGVLHGGNIVVHAR